MQDPHDFCRPAAFEKQLVPRKRDTKELQHNFRQINSTSPIGGSRHKIETRNTHNSNTTAAQQHQHSRTPRSTAAHSRNSEPIGQTSYLLGIVASNSTDALCVALASTAPQYTHTRPMRRAHPSLVMCAPQQWPSHADMFPLPCPSTGGC